MWNYYHYSGGLQLLTVKGFICVCSLSKIGADFATLRIIQRALFWATFLQGSIAINVESPFSACFYMFQILTGWFNKIQPLLTEARSSKNIC